MILNKRLFDFPTFHSGNSKIQINYLRIRCCHFTTVIGYEVVRYDTLAHQHRLIAILK